MPGTDLCWQEHLAAEQPAQPGGQTELRRATGWLTGQDAAQIWEWDTTDLALTPTAAAEAHVFHMVA